MQRERELHPLGLEAGYTLLEAVMAMSLVGLLFGSFAFFSYFLTSQGNDGEGRESWAYEAHAAMSEMEQAIRLAVEVTQGGQGVLTVETQYYEDLDDGIERIGYQLTDGQLLRAVAEGNDPFSKWEVVLSPVDSFEPFSFMIEDGFDAVDYAALSEPTGEPTDPDTATQADYKVKELSAIDSDLAASYNLTDENLVVIASVASHKGIVVSPPLEKIGLVARVKFTPHEDAVEYWPLVWAADADVLDGVGILFLDDGSIHFKSVDRGTTLGDHTAPFSWSVDGEYTIEIQFEGNGVHARIKEDGGWTDLGLISTGDLDNKHVRLVNMNSSTGGAWDDLSVKYAFVSIEISTTLEDGTQYTFRGGATPRALRD